MPEISVVIPTYNYGRYLPTAIDSVLAQQGVDVEVVVVDDGSTDNTQEVLGAYVGRIRVLQQNNQGAPAARNLGLQEARGEFILFLDADDRLLPDALLSRLEYLRLHPECDWVYGPQEYRSEHGGDDTVDWDYSRFAYRYARQGNILAYLLLGELIQTSTVLARCETVRQIGGFRLDLPVLQDYELWLRLAAVARVGYVEESNVVVMTHPSSLSHSSKDNYRTLLMILEDAEARYPQAVRELGYAWRKRMAKVLLERSAHLLAQGSHEQARKYLLRAVRENPLQWKTYYHLLKSWI